MICQAIVLVAKTMISSRLDYHNSPLYGVSKASCYYTQASSKCFLQHCFQMDRMSQVTSQQEKQNPLASYSMWYPFQIKPHFESHKFRPTPYLSSLIKSSSLTHANRLSVSSVGLKNYRQAWFCHRCTSGDPNRPFQDLDAKSRLTCLVTTTIDILPCRVLDWLWLCLF